MVLDETALDKTAQKFGITTKELVNNLETMESNLKEDSVEVDRLKASLAGVDGAATGAAAGVKKFSNALKAIGKTVG